MKKTRVKEINLIENKSISPGHDYELRVSFDNDRNHCVFLRKGMEVREIVDALKFLDRGISTDCHLKD